VACGRAEGFWEYKLKPWDVAAGILLVREAGGKVTDFLGGPLDVTAPVRTLATNGRVHSKLIAVFRKNLRRFLTRA
jgi:myo-inositol-1(or 4)-monophosphatase